MYNICDVCVCVCECDGARERKETSYKSMRVMLFFELFSLFFRVARDVCVKGIS